MKDQTNTPTVLITGALTGIGRATAFAFAREGARVVVSGRHNDEGQKLANELRKLGTEAEFVRTDVRLEEEVKELVDRPSLVSAASTLPLITHSSKIHAEVKDPVVLVLWMSVANRKLVAYSQGPR